MRRGGRWSEVLNHLSVFQQRGGGSRSEWLGAAGGDVKISSSLVVTLSSTTCFLSFSFHSLPPSSSIVSFMTPPPPPSSSSPS